MHWTQSKKPQLILTEHFGGKKWDLKLKGVQKKYPLLHFLGLFFFFITVHLQNMLNGLYDPHSLNLNPRNHPKLLSQKSWYLCIWNGPIARGYWNLDQSIKQKIKNFQLEKCRYITDITDVLGHCTVFSLKTAQIFIWKNLFTEILWPACSCQVHQIYWSS